MAMSTVDGADHCAFSKFVSGSGAAVRSCTVLVRDWHPVGPLRTYHTLATRSGSMISDGETASWLGSENASVGCDHCRAVPVDMIMMLFVEPVTSRYTCTRRPVAGSNAWSGSELYWPAPGNEMIGFRTSGGVIHVVSLRTSRNAGF